mmetsp:Transcript_13016/g.35034  ORF Transcript_13016/g.35034 Transcript_13016/m.35034 type:complete len:208 (+) Transcript_13016:729-1352(+)
MRTFRLTRTIAQPDEMARRRVILASLLVQTGQRLFIGKQQSFVRNVELSLANHRRVGLKTDGVHKLDRGGDRVGKLPEASSLVGAIHKFKIDFMDATQVEIPSCRERSEQIDGRSRLHECLPHPLRVGQTLVAREIGPIDHVAAVRRKLELLVFRLFKRRRPRLCKLPCHAPDLDHGAARSVHHHDRHLDQQRKRVPNVFASVLFKL